MKLNIGFAQPSACVRTKKMMEALRGHVSKIVYLYRDPDISAFKLADVSRPIRQWSDIKQVCREQELDILQCANWPDDMAYSALKQEVECKVVHDSHDVGSLYLHLPSLADTVQKEKFVCENADGILSVAQGSIDYLKRQYGFNCPTHVLYNYPLKAWIPADVDESIGFDPPRFAYEGGIVEATDQYKENHYRYYKGIFKALMDQGAQVHVWPRYRSGMPAGYQDLGLQVHAPERGSRELIPKMRGYTAGLVIYNEIKRAVRLIDVVVGNKMFEYVAAGLPVISTSTVEHRRIIERENLGIIIPDDFRLPEHWKEDLEVAKKTVLSKRFIFTMEDQIPALLKFYEAVLDA